MKYEIIEHCDDKMAYKLYENDATNEDGTLVMCDYDKYPDKYSHWKGDLFGIQTYSYFNLLMYWCIYYSLGSPNLPKI